MKKRVYFILAIIATLAALLVIFLDVFHDTKRTTATTNTSSNLAFTITMQPEYTVIKPNDLYTAADLVFTGKYVTENKTFVIRDVIATEATFHVTNILKGNLSTQQAKNNVNLQYYGGEMLLGDFLDQLDKKQVKNPDMLKSYSEKDRKTKKVTTTVENQANKTKDQNTTYLIFASYHSATNTYQVLGDEFGMRKIDDQGNVWNPQTKQFEKVDFYPAK